MLFGTVRLVASAEHADVVAKTDLAVLKQHVRNVTFEPSKESWVTKCELFDDIILGRPFDAAMGAYHEKFEHTAEDMGFNEFSTKRDKEFKALGPRGFTEKYFPEGQELFSEEEMDVDEGVE